MATTYETRDVLAGAYPGKGNKAPKAMLSHTVAIDEVGDEKVLCPRVQTDNLADACAGDVNAAPTCPVCLKRDPRKF